MAAKPADYFVSAFDFFAFLVPGLLLVMSFSQELLSLLFPSAPLNKAWEFKEWGLAIVTSYVVGHFLYAASAYFGRKFYPFYYQRLASKRSKIDIDSRRKLAAAELNKEQSAEYRGENWELILRRAKAALTINQKEAYDSLVYLEAVSKFFRSIAAVGAVIAVFYAAPVLTGLVRTGQIPVNSYPCSAVVWAVVAVFALLRFANRQKEHEHRTLDAFLASRRLTSEKGQLNG